MAIAAAATDGPTFLSAQTAGPSTAQKTEATAAAEVEIQRQLNELRREALDDRSDTLGLWLAVIGILATLLVGGAGYIGVNKVRQSAEKAREAAEQAAVIVEKIKKNVDRSEEYLQRLTSEEIRDPDSAEKTHEAVQAVRHNLDTLPLDRAIADASNLQQEGKTQQAIEKWRAIANLAEGNDNLVARAWFSVGYVLHAGRHGEISETTAAEVTDAYDKAIGLRPDYAEAYNNRGVAKSSLGRNEEAIADFDEAIRLNPRYADAYNNRGASRGALSRYEEAIADFNQAIRLGPDDAQAHNNLGACEQRLGSSRGRSKGFRRGSPAEPQTGRSL